MAIARIYQPTKTAMQSGKSKTTTWCIEFNVNNERFKDPLMGWTAIANTLGQLNLKFKSSDAAISFAQKHGLDFIVEEPQLRKQQIRHYSDNFRFDLPVG